MSFRASQPNLFEPRCGDLSTDILLEPLKFFTSFNLLRAIFLVRPSMSKDFDDILHFALLLDLLEESLGGLGVNAVFRVGARAKPPTSLRPCGEVIEV